MLTNIVKAFHVMAVAVQLGKLKVLKMLFSFNSSQRYQEASGFNQDPLLTSVSVVIFIIIEVFGNAMLCGVLHFEKYSMDPLKRTATNQLVYQFIWIIIINNIVALPILIGRIIFGPLGNAKIDLC